jgi:hypothetical protein
MRADDTPTLRQEGFSEILKDIPADWGLIGGHAVPFWAARYAIHVGF